MSLYASRQARNRFYIGLCYAASAFGLAFLLWIMIILILRGAAGLNLSLFTERTLQSGGGLANAMIGSVMMSAIAVIVGTPIGLLAGTYLAEYGAGSKIAFVIRFINDILLSAPSIVVGVFIFQIVVVPSGGASGFAGAMALTIILIPVVVRTTEDMLLLVPTPLREASAALGMPKSMIVQRIAYKAARAGLTTGVLLAVSRIAGETAPLIFTALNNDFTSFNLAGPMASIPTALYAKYDNAAADQRQLVWAGALVITFVVLLMSITARTLNARTKTR